MWPFHYALSSMESKKNNSFNLRYFFVLLLLLLNSCGGQRYKTPDVREAIDRNGPVEVPLVQDGKKVVMYYTAGGFAFSMQDVPHGKIDGIIRDNPDWQFLFYVHCQTDEEVEFVRKWLANIGDDFAVRIDRDNAFRKANNMDEYGSIGFILDEKGRKLSVCVIGTPRSFFDSEFRKAKRMLGH